MAMDAAACAIEAGRIRNALVVGAEKLSSVTDWTIGWRLMGGGYESVKKDARAA